MGLDIMEILTFILLRRVFVCLCVSYLCFESFNFCVLILQLCAQLICSHLLSLHYLYKVDVFLHQNLSFNDDVRITEKKRKVFKYNNRYIQRSTKHQHVVACCYCAALCVMVENEWITKTDWIWNLCYWENQMYADLPCIKRILKALKTNNLNELLLQYERWEYYKCKIFCQQFRTAWFDIRDFCILFLSYSHLISFECLTHEKL